MAEGSSNVLIVKIAVGVCLGVLAASIFYHMPGWYREHKADQAKERQASIDARLLEMKPMDFVVRCGNVVNDKTTRFGSGAVASIFRRVTVEMTMRDGVKKKVTAEWSAVDASDSYDPSDWLLSSVGGLEPTSDTWRPIIEGNYPCTVKPPKGGFSDLSLLTPKEVIQSCGKPIRDKREDDGTEVTRFLTFETTTPAQHRKKVIAVFSGFGKPGTSADLTLRYFGGLSVGDDSPSVIEKRYPCVKPRETPSP